MSTEITENRNDVILNQYFELTLRTELDLTGVTTLVAKIIKPDQSAADHAVTITNYTEGYVLITFAQGELNQLGLWEIKITDTVSGITSRKTFDLYINSFWEK